MRLLSFVPCGCHAGPIDDAPPVEAAAKQSSSSSAAAGDGAASARRRRRRARSMGSQWRPSLGDIYEEYSSNEAGKGGARAGKPAARDVARVLPRAHGDEYRHIETATSLPSFAPAVFLF